MTGTPPIDTAEPRNSEGPEGPNASKIRSLDDLAVIARAARENGETIVHAHGTFDLLHIGHLRHLREARREGTMLIVTLTADAFVNKGPGRPVFSEQMRAEMMAALDCVDYVAICADALAVPAIRKLKPHIYVKGQDYSRDEEDVTGGIVAERHAVEAHGGRVVFTDEMTFSSTTLINRHLGIFEPRLDQYLETQRDRGMLDKLTALSIASGTCGC